MDCKSEAAEPEDRGCLPPGIIQQGTGLSVPLCTAVGWWSTVLLALLFPCSMVEARERERLPGTTHLTAPAPPLTPIDPEMEVEKSKDNQWVLMDSAVRGGHRAVKETPCPVQVGKLRPHQAFR